MKNPLVPAIYDFVWLGVALVPLALLAWALVSIGRRRQGLTPELALVWSLVAIFLPVIGPCTWLLVGRRLAQSPTGPPRPQS